MSWTETAVVLAQGALGAGLLLALARLVRGPSLPDRVVALDLSAALAAGLAAVYAIDRGEPAALSAAIVLSLLSFLGTVAFARFVQRRGPE